MILPIIFAARPNYEGTYLKILTYAGLTIVFIILAIVFRKLSHRIKLKPARIIIQILLILAALFFAANAAFAINNIIWFNRVEESTRRCLQEWEEKREQYNPSSLEYHIPPCPV